MISLTYKAAERMKSSLESRGKGLGIRIGVKTSGCSGYAYVLEFVDVYPNDDIMYELQGVKLFVNRKNEVYLNGMEVDWVKEGLNEGFKFNNPNVTAECGCGESFSI
jgi:iron-sulfur cluster assembly protein